MKNLLFKEFKLSVHPTSYIFLTFAVMLLIPNYPYYVAFFYQTLAVFFTFLDGNTTNDIFFTSLLPIRKRDVVKARVITVVILEVLQIIVSVPFAWLRATLIPLENQAGMEANAALFGLVLMMFGIFNAIILPLFYQTGYKAGGPYLISCLGMTLFAGAAEAAVNLIPGWKVALDTTNPAFMPQQMLVFCAGLAVFALLTLFAYKKSAGNFERLDL